MAQAAVSSSKARRHQLGGSSFYAQCASFVTCKHKGFFECRECLGRPSKPQRAQEQAVSSQTSELRVSLRIAVSASTQLLRQHADSMPFGSNRPVQQSKAPAAYAVMCCCLCAADARLVIHVLRAQTIAKLELVQTVVKRQTITIQRHTRVPKAPDASQMQCPLDSLKGTRRICIPRSYSNLQFGQHPVVACVVLAYHCSLS